MRLLALGLTLLALTACGVDGDPSPQTPDGRPPGVSFSGEARIGVVG